MLIVLGLWVCRPALRLGWVLAAVLIVVTGHQPTNTTNICTVTIASQALD